MPRIAPLPENQRQYGGSTDTDARSRISNQDERTKIKVLLITGFSRSGSTILGRLLGQYPGVFFGGELHSIWKRNAQHNELCGCGKAFRHCDEWTRIFARAFGGHLIEELEEICAAQNATTRMRHWLFNAWPCLRSSRRAEEIGRYNDAVRKLFQAIAQETGCRMIVDTSKNPSYGLYLATVPEIDLHVMHLVRDCRAVVYSWKRKRRLHDVHWAKQDMEQFSSPWTTLFWSVTNVLTDINSLFIKKFAFLRYDDFAQNPHEVLNRILAYTNHHEMVRSSSSGNTFTVCQPEHSVGGNPGRFKRGDLTVMPDDEWRLAHTKVRNLLIVFLIWPLMFRYVWTRKLPLSGLAAQRRH